MKKSAVSLSTKNVHIQKANATIVTTIIISSIIVSFSVVFLNILWSQRGFNSRVHDAKEQVRDTLQQNVASTEPLIESFRALEAGANLIPDQGSKTNSEVVLDALPSKYDYVAFVNSIIKLVDDTGVQLTSFSGTDEEASAIASSPDPVPIEIAFSVSVTGTYDGINRLIDAFDRNIRPMKIQDISLSGSDTGMTATFNMITYYKPTIDLNPQSSTLQ